MSDLPKIVTVGVDGRPFSTVLVKAQRPGHWTLDPPRPLDVYRGVIALSTTGDPLRADGGRNLWASAFANGPSGGSTSLEGANSVLTFLNSEVRLTKGSTPELVGRFPHYADLDPPFNETYADGSPTVANKLFPVIPVRGTSPPPLYLPTDCGEAACFILGAEKKNTKFSTDGREFPMQNESPQETVLFVLTHLLSPEKADDLSTNFHNNHDIYQEALDKYLDMPESDKRAFDKKHGINKFARATAGEAFVIVNMHMNAVNDRVPIGKESEGYCHHWGAVLMDFHKVQITLENQDGNSAFGWYFAMYGNLSLPEGDVRGVGVETFHGHHGNEGYFATDAFTMVARP